MYIFKHAMSLESFKMFLDFLDCPAPGLSGLVAEMIQATGDIGTQWILDLCNSIAIDRYKWRKMIKDVR